MALTPTRNDWLSVFGIVAVIFGGTILALREGSLTAVALALAGGILIVSLLTVLCHRSLMYALVSRHELTEYSLKSNYRQAEALEMILSVLRPRLPLPPMRGMAISPDFGRLLVAEILTKKPQVILELGCGVSTLIAAYCVAKNGSGVVSSIDHDGHYAAVCREQLRQHQLAGCAVVHHAPLKRVRLSDTEVLYYDFSAVPLPDQVDLLIIDGPPAPLQENIRYPALPMLIQHLSAHASVLVDDTNRADESRMVSLWKQEYPEFECEEVDTEKGAVILRRSLQNK